MIPLEGQFIDVVFRNGIKLSGRVVYWSDQESVIENNGTIVINKTKEDVLFYIIKDGSSSSKELAEKIAEKIEEEKKSIIAPEKLPKLAQLKKEYLEHEKKSISDQMRESDLKNKAKNLYESPFGTKQESIKHSTKEITREDNRNLAILQNMFRKKEK